MSVARAGEGETLPTTYSPNQERLDRMREAMAFERIDALVLRLPENVLLLSGFWPMIGASVLVFPLEGEPACIVPACYEREAGDSLWHAQPTYYAYGVLDAPQPAFAIREILANLGANRNWRRIGYEGGFEVIAPSWNSAESIIPASPAYELLESAFEGCELVDATRLLQAQRVRKTWYETQKLRTASEISRFGLDAFHEGVASGVSGVELVARVEHAVMLWGAGYKGAVRVRAYAQVAVGQEETAVGYRPNEISTVRKLRDGDVALLELGVVADGYWADRTRVCVAGRATDEQIRVFDTVRRAQEAAVAAIRPGVKAAEVDEAARSIIRDQGYGPLFPHITGHGLGFRYHESSPKLAPGVNESLEEGMFTSVEPGIYGPKFGGFRIEDDVLVTHEGREVLGPFPKLLT